MSDRRPVEFQISQNPITLSMFAVCITDALELLLNVLGDRLASDKEEFFAEIEATIDHKLNAVLNTNERLPQAVEGIEIARRVIGEAINAARLHRG